MRTIFIQIASYRDPELPATISSALQAAQNPDRLRFGICWQFDDETASDLDEYENDDRFLIDKIRYEESRGCCWARSRTNQLYRDEDYTLQIDAHMRFSEGWDDRIIDMLESIEHDKPLLTTYPPPYYLRNGVAELQMNHGVQKLKLKQLRSDLTTEQGAELVEQTERPGKSPLLAAGYMFTLGHFCREVEYDPNLYFHGEEISLAVRAFTHGYNLYYPHENLVWHQYKHDAPLHWTDHQPVYQGMEKRAIEQLETLLLGDHTRLGKYGLGEARTLEQFEDYANIRFSEAKDRQIREGETRLFDKEIIINTTAIEQRNDYELWVFCLLNENDEELFRLDITDSDVLVNRNDRITICEEIPGTPSKYMIWPKTPQGWGEKYIYRLDNEITHNPAPDAVESTAKIFVALAAYCEPELRLTIQSCIDNAVNPGRLHFGVCLQYDDDGVEEIHQDSIDDLLGQHKILIVKYPYTSSKGGCWARNIVQSLYRNEEYTLQVDAHSRMVEGWDNILINMMHELPSSKPLITGFPPLYFINDGKEEFISRDDLTCVPTTKIASWSEDGWIHHPTEFIPENSAFPRRTRVISGAFVFTLGRWNIEVNQDPDHLYTGEEFALTLRSYTSGYDLFNPSQIVLWHRGHPQPNRKYISDFDQQSVDNRHKNAVRRLNILLEGDPEQQLEPFSLGGERTLEDYRIFSGLDCSQRHLHEDAVNGVPPNPVTIIEDYTGHGMQNNDADTAMLDITIQLAGMSNLELRCENSSPVLKDLISALDANTQRREGDPDPLMFLQFGDNEDHEIYFLQSRLLSLQAWPVGTGLNPG